MLYTKNMKHLQLYKGIFCILLFCFSALSAQKITIINNTGEPFTVKDGKKELVLNEGGQKEFSGGINRLLINSGKNINRSFNIFLEPTEKLTITMKAGNTVVYTGDQAIVNEYLNEKLNAETYGKMKEYQNAVNRKNAGELKNTSELFLSGVLKKMKLSGVLLSPEDKGSAKKIKNHIKYNWLYTVLSTVATQKDKVFTQQAMHYYYKKYIESDLSQYSCSGTYQYNVIEILAKNKDMVQIELPKYPIVESTDADPVNQYLPKSCQRYYFQKKYDYLEHIHDPQKNYYEKVLNEKFNDL